MAPTDEFLSVRQAAEIKACSRQTIYNAIERGDLNGTKIGTYHTVLRDEAFRRWKVKVKHRANSSTNPPHNDRD